MHEHVRFVEKDFITYLLFADNNFENIVPKNLIVPFVNISIPAFTN